MDQDFAEIGIMKMTGQTYNWKRFWCPREEHVALTNVGFRNTLVL